MRSKFGNMTSMKWILMLFPILGYGMQISETIPFNALIFDIGAHQGYKAQVYLVDRRARRVVCVEPQADCIEFMKRKLSSFFYTRYRGELIIVQKVVSDKIGTISFFPNKNAPAIATVDEDWKFGRFKDQIWDEPIEVATTTLDQLIGEYGMPSFCKIDVEGHEYAVLRGMSTPIPYLSFEFNREFVETKTQSCMEYLTGLGYRYFNIGYADSDSFASDQWMDAPLLLDTIKNNPDPLCWGDIYARL